MKNGNARKSGLIVIILILLILAIIGGGAYAYLVTDLFKTPEQLFKKYLLDNAIQLTQTNFEPFKEMSERAKNEIAEYNLNVLVNPVGEDSVYNNKYDMNFKLTTDYKNRNENLELIINKNDNKILDGTFAVTGDTLGLKIPDLYDKYIAVENRDLKKIAKTFELSEEVVKTIPDKIPFGFDENENEKINELANKYLNKIMDQLDESNYIAEKNINIVVNSQKIVADKYTLSISSKKTYTLLTNAITELLDDPEFLSLCENRIPTEGLEQIKTSYQNIIKETTVEDIEEKTIEISIYATDGKTVKTELKVDENEAYFIIENKEKESAITFSVIEPKNDYHSVGSTNFVTIKNVYENNSGELTYEIATTYDKSDIEDLQKEYDSNNDFDYDDDFYIDYSEMYADESFKYIVKTKKINEDTIKGEITLEVGNESNTEMDFVDVSFKCQFGKGKVEVLTKDNSEIINDYTMEDYEKLFNKIATNLMTTVIENPNSLLGLFLNINGNSSLEDDTYIDSEDYTIDSDTEIYDDITFTEDYDNDNYLYPTTSFDIEKNKEKVEFDITYGLNSALNNYKNELYINPEANLEDFLTIENVEESCNDRYTLELIDSTTIKCTVLGDVEYIYYALMNIDGNELIVTDVEVLTEDEYLSR